MNLTCREADPDYYYEALDAYRDELADARRDAYLDSLEDEDEAGDFPEDDAEPTEADIADYIAETTGGRLVANTEA